MAPDGETICPKVDPISEDIKYRLFNLEIAEADLHISEDKSISRVQSAGLDLELCTCHTNDETMGLSWQLQSLTVTGLLPDPQEPTIHLQVGVLDVNNLQGNLALREPLECVASRQLSFLRKADARTRRLWFLWKEAGSSMLCGCCGGCLFMSSSVARKHVIARNESAVYGAQFAPLTSIPRHLGLQGLNQALLLTKISDLECMWALHKGLLGHYQARYVDRASLLHVSSPLQQQRQVQDERSSKVLSVSDASFVSARSSLTSLLAEEYKSMYDINIETVEEVLTHKTGHMRKPSNLSFDLRADRTDFDDPDSLHSGYQGVVGSHFLHTVTLQIPCSDTPTGQGEDIGSTRYRVHHRQSASDTSFLMRGPSPDTSPSSGYFQLRVPCLAQDSGGTLPLITQTAKATQTLERRCRGNLKQATSDGQQDADRAKFSLSVRISASNRILLSPPLLSIIAK